jgi:SAM-dependent methyltransferase
MTEQTTMFDFIVNPGNPFKERMPDTVNPESVKAFLSETFKRVETSEAGFRTRDLRPLITELTLAGERDIYVWDEMNKISEMTFISESSPFMRPVVDLCCGYGYWITKLLSVIDLGIDMFPDEGKYKRSLEGVKDRHFIDNTYQAVMKFDVTMDLPVPDDSAGTVLCICALEHIADYRNVLEQVRRILKPGGRFILTLDTARLTELAGEMFHPDFVCKFKKENFLETLLDLNGWRRILTGAGFEILRVKGYLDRLRTYLFLMTFYPDGYGSIFSKAGLADVFRKDESFRRLWNETCIPWMTKAVDPEEAMVVCFDCTLP